MNLTAFIGVQSLGLDMLMKSGSTVGSVGPAVSLPLGRTIIRHEWRRVKRGV
ncbi:hypothetical protein [Phenylobacterium sp.]|uniref:hypothetical protein n=1 Tax=Phenylobacterium sp. TaxID=1871053 RepID=UPI002ED7D798